MTEVLILGRGGQGAFTAAKLLGMGYAQGGEDHVAIAFPSFGPERRGAPIRAFVKLDTKPIHDRSEIRVADYIIVLDEGLYSDGLLSIIKEGGRVLLSGKTAVQDARVFTIDAQAIAMEILRRPIVNTAMLGALCALEENIGLHDMQHAISHTFKERLVEGNKALVQRAYAQAMQERGGAS